MPELPVLLFSDFASPYAWLAEAVLRRLQGESVVEIRYVSVELFPAPGAPGQPPALDEAAPLAHALGVELARPGHLPRTRKAHELAHFARDRGVEGAVRDAVHTALWRDGRDIGRIDVLAAIARECGLDATEARVVLDIDRYADAVAADQALAVRAGVRGVPLARLGGGDAAVWMEGAFSLDEWRRAAAQARTHR